MLYFSLPHHPPRSFSSHPNHAADKCVPSCGIIPKLAIAKNIINTGLFKAVDLALYNSIFSFISVTTFFASSRRSAKDQSFRSCCRHLQSPSRPER